MHIRQSTQHRIIFVILYTIISLCGSVYAYPDERDGPYKIENITLPELDNKGIVSTLMPVLEYVVKDVVNDSLSIAGKNHFEVMIAKTGIIVRMGLDDGMLEIAYYDPENTPVLLGYVELGGYLFVLYRYRDNPIRLSSAHSGNKHRFKIKKLYFSTGHELPSKWDFEKLANSEYALLLYSRGLRPK